MFPLVFLSSNWLGIVCKGPRISNKPIFIARFNVDELYLFNDLTKDIYARYISVWNIQGDHYACQRIFFNTTAAESAAATAAASSPLSTLLETSLIGKLSWTSRSHSTHHVTEHNNSHMIVWQDWIDALLVWFSLISRHYVRNAMLLWRQNSNVWRKDTFWVVFKHCVEGLVNVILEGNRRVSRLETTPHATLQKH